MRAAKRREGNGGGAHRGCSGRRSGLGDALETAGRRWGSTAAGGEEGDGDGSTGRPARHGLTERWWTTWRSYRTRREGEGEVVAAAMACGGDGAFGRSRGRETRGRGGMRERERGAGRRVASFQGVRGDEEDEAGGGRTRGRGRLWRGHAPAWVRGRRRQRKRRLGRASQLGRPGRTGAGPQVSLPLLFLFLFF